MGLATYAVGQQGWRGPAVLVFGLFAGTGLVQSARTPRP